MKTPEQVIIPLSKTRILWLFLLSLLFVVLGLWFLLSPPDIKHPILGNSQLIFLTGLSSAFFFSIMAVMYLKKLFQRSPGIIINSEGITDNSSGVAAGFIKWDDLEKISVMELRKQKLLMLYVHNPQYYISRQRNAIKRKIMQINHKSFATPISISTNGLHCKFDELYDLVDQYMSHRQI